MVVKKKNGGFVEKFDIEGKSKRLRNKETDSTFHAFSPKHFHTPPASGQGKKKATGSLLWCWWESSKHTNLRQQAGPHHTPLQPPSDQYKPSHSPCFTLLHFRLGRNPSLWRILLMFIVKKYTFFHLLLMPMCHSCQTSVQFPGRGCPVSSRGH